jgi:hypothetical protein
VDGEKRTYNLFPLGHENANGSTKDNGAAFFQYSLKGLTSSVNNLVIIFNGQIEWYYYRLGMETKKK